MRSAARCLIQQSRTVASNFYCRYPSNLSRWRITTKIASRCAVSYVKRGRPTANQDLKDPYESLDIVMQKWAESFDSLLPKKLRITNEVDEEPQDLTLDIFNQMLGHEELGNPIFWMIINGHRRSGLWLLHAAQDALAARVLQTERVLPSNIAWKNDLFESIKQDPVSQDLVVMRGAEKGRLLDDHMGPSVNPMRNMTDTEQVAESFIWRTIAELVLHSSDPIEPADESRDTMSAALLAIGKFHEHGLMPDRVYDATVPSSASYLRKAPILHLVSARILTALSDATWREHQQETIEQSLESGQSLKDIAQSAPGGRFLLKVRPLGPEIWLELVLSTFIELGYYHDAAWLIQKLGTETPDEPWHAVRWCSHEYTAGLDVRIDWDRLKARTGGTVGRIEGYSAEKPFVDVPTKTISVEAVLATVDGLLAQNLTEGRLAQLKNLFEFLEPHDLSPGYLDYLQTRPCHYGRFQTDQSMNMLGSWCDLVDSIRQMESITEVRADHRDLSLFSISKHAMLPLALQHQRFHGLIVSKHIHTVLPLFNQIQESVDNHKLASIESFIENQQNPSEANHVSATLEKYRLEYAGTDGHLPNHILGSFLKLVTENKLIGLGQWLLFADDADGPLIPQSAYAESSLLGPLTEYATVAANHEFHQELKSVIKKHEEKRLLSVRLIRTLANVEMTAGHFNTAANILRLLISAQGGGFSTSNLAHITASIIRLEGSVSKIDMRRSMHLDQAYNLLREILTESYETRRADFTRNQRSLFKSQISHLLSLMIYLKSPDMSLIARRAKKRFNSGNTPSLPPQIFNIVLDAVAEARGSLVARDMCDVFCAEFGDDLESERYLPVDESSDKYQLADDSWTEAEDVEPTRDHSDSKALSRFNDFVAPQSSSISTSPLLEEDISHEVGPSSASLSSTTSQYFRTDSEARNTEARSLDEQSFNDIGLNTKNALFGDHEAELVEHFEENFFSRDIMDSIDSDNDQSRDAVTDPAHSVRDTSTSLEEGDAEVYIQRLQDEADQTNPLVQFMPVTIPNIQTLRIVVRQAIAERNFTQAERTESTIKYRFGQRTARLTLNELENFDSMRSWAIRKFKLFDIGSPEVLDQELQQPVTQFDIAAAYKDGRQKRNPYSKRTDTKRFQSQISKMWQPNRVRNDPDQPRRERTVHE